MSTMTPGGLIGVIVDITACKEAEEALRRSEEKYRLLVENQTDLVVKVDAGGHFLYVSPSYCRTFGRPEEDLLGKTFMPLVHEDDLPATREAMLALHHPPHTAYMEQRARTVGGWRWFAWNDTAVLGPDGAIREVLGVGRDITARKEAEEALAASEKRFRTLFEVAQDSILVLRGGRIEDCNRSTEELLGRPRDAIVGREPAELSPAVQPNGADSLQYQRQLLAETTSGKRLLFDWSFLHPGGALVAVEVALQSIAGEAPGLLLAMVRDVTERRRQERLLRQSEEKFSRLFRLSPDNVLLSEVESGKLVEANESFLSFHGLTREQAIGSTIAELGLYGDIRRRQDLVRILRQNGRVENFEMEVLRHDGSLRVGLLSAQMMEIEGRPLMMSMLRDITETKRMQEMMVQTEKMISVGGIAAGVAHEINNPLGIVLQATQNLVRRTRPDLPRNISAARAIGLDMELLRRYMQERKLDAFIEDIQSAAVRAAAIIRHMLDFSRHSESRRKVCDLPGIVRKAMDLAKSDYDLKRSYDFRRIQVDMEIGDDLPEINCTETEIEQVILNLLRNSAQAMASAIPPVAAPRIDIRLSARPGGVCIEVEDNGPGIPPGVRHRIFEPFFTTKAPGVGTGLGLSVSYFIVTKGHGGTMRVESTPGSGTTFIIDLPTEETRP